MVIAYACRLRGIELVTLTDANATEVGVLSNRRKGSRDNVTRWTPELRGAWDALVELRKAAYKRHDIDTVVQLMRKIAHWSCRRRASRSANRRSTRPGSA